MSHTAGRIFVCNEKYLCWSPNEAVSPSSNGVDLQSAVQSLSLRSLDDMDDEQHARRRHGRVKPTQIGLRDQSCLLPLSRSHSRLQVTQDASLSIWRKDVGVYLIAYESWNHVIYLQVSNADGYFVTCGGLLLVPTMVHSSNDQRYMLASIVYNSLWTNGKVVLNNVGSSTVQRYNPLNAYIPSIELVVKSRLMDDPASQSGWRARIENAVLRNAMGGIEGYEESQLRVKRREYLLRRSLEILNECVDVRNLSDVTPQR
ncbi:hypothetical protein MHU86_4539 [Fragilaria crotonensis]|nr:hypothetical protein MHU86_4539 [Fragilaria crotonensis]